MRKVGHTVSVPAGKYWLGDPCYAVPDHLWHDLLDSSYCFENPIGKVKADDGKVHRVLAFGTAYGDGVYADQFGNQFPVDAGLIGLTPVGLAEGVPFGATLVEFTYETVCMAQDGVMQFGKYKINTRDDEEDDDDA
jgi:hypothetical protein